MAYRAYNPDLGTIASDRVFGQPPHASLIRFISITILYRPARGKLVKAFKPDFRCRYMDLSCRSSTCRIQRKRKIHAPYHPFVGLQLCALPRSWVQAFQTYKNVTSILIFRLIPK